MLLTILSLEKKSLSWLNNHIKRLIRRGKKQEWSKFRQMRKVVHKETGKAHQEYINNLFDFQDEDNIDNVSTQTIKSLPSSVSGSTLKLNARTWLAYPS